MPLLVAVIVSRVQHVGKQHGPLLSVLGLVLQLQKVDWYMYIVTYYWVFVYKTRSKLYIHFIDTGTKFVHQLLYALVNICTHTYLRVYIHVYN